MRAVVGVHGRFHGFDLARELHRHGHLSRLLTTYPSFIVRRFLPPNLPLVTAPRLEALRRAGQRFAPGWSLDFTVARSFARFAARHLPPDMDVYVGWSGASLEAMLAAQARGARLVLERGSTHIDHQTAVLAEEYRRWKLAWRPTDPRLVERERAEYHLAERIMVGSQASAQSFVERGIAPHKLVVNPYGVDLERFRAVPRCASGQGRVRILFAGQVGVRKGVPTLLRAFARLKMAVELHLVGPLEPGFAAVLERLPLDRVVVRGPVAGADMPGEYAAAEIFCLPSVEEGFGMVILQAMATGLPVIASSATGLVDLKTGIVVPPGDERALADALERLATDPAARSQLGALARQRVADGFGWEQYGDRAIAALRAL